MVPLAGHTVGHAGIAIRGPEGWLLHAGDAYFYHGEMDPRGYHCTPMLRAYQKLMEVDREVRLWNQQRLRELKQAHGAEIEAVLRARPERIRRRLRRRRPWEPRPRRLSDRRQ